MPKWMFALVFGVIAMGLGLWLWYSGKYGHDSHLQDNAARLAEKVPALRTEPSPPPPPQPQTTAAPQVTDKADPGTAVGPSGEAPGEATAIKMTADEIQPLLQAKAPSKAILLLEIADAMQAQAVQAGIMEVLTAAGVKTVSFDGDQNQPEWQAVNIERALAGKPAVVISSPANPAIMGATYRRIGKAGIPLILLDQLPAGLKPGRDYASLVTAANRDCGSQAAEMLGQALDGKGKVAILSFPQPHYPAGEREAGFRYRLQQRFPEMSVAATAVTEGGDEAYFKTEELLAGHPDIAGLLVISGELVQAAGRAAHFAGRTAQDLPMVTIGLTPEGATDIATGGYLRGAAVPDHLRQGRMAGEAALCAILKREIPSFLVVPGIGITRANLLEKWPKLFRNPPPAELTAALKKVPESLPSGATRR